VLTGAELTAKSRNASKKATWSKKNPRASNKHYSNDYITLF
jgi:hypothetical protein